MQKDSRDTAAERTAAAAERARRARGLAQTENRGAAEELLAAGAGGTGRRDRELPDAVNEDADSMQSMSRDPSDPMTNRGRQVPEYGGDDEKAALEHLALEGVEEAQHDQMVAAHNDDDETRPSRPKPPQP